MTGIIFVLLHWAACGGLWERSGNGHLRWIRPNFTNWWKLIWENRLSNNHTNLLSLWSYTNVQADDNRCKSTDSFSEHRSRITNLFMPNVDMANCSGGRSFSKLKRTKNELRSTMHQERLNRLTLMSLEQEVLREIELRELIDKFAKVNSQIPKNSDLQVTLYQPESRTRLTVIILD